MRSFVVFALAATAVLLPAVSAGRIPAASLAKRDALDPVFDGLDDPLPEAFLVGEEDDEDTFSLKKRVVLGCRDDSQCRTTAANAVAQCLQIPGRRTKRCTVVCKSGYYQRYGACVAQISACGGGECPAIDNGYNLCLNRGDKKECTAFCYSNLGFRLFKNSQTGASQCYNIASDTNNCGTPGNVCKTGYNHIGYASCANAVCRLDCPPGYRLRAAQGSTPAFCQSTA